MNASFLAFDAFTGSLIEMPTAYAPSSSTDSPHLASIPPVLSSHPLRHFRPCCDSSHRLLFAGVFSLLLFLFAFSLYLCLLVLHDLFVAVNGMVYCWSLISGNLLFAHVLRNGFSSSLMSSSEASAASLAYLDRNHPFSFSHDWSLCGHEESADEELERGPDPQWMQTTSSSSPSGPVLLAGLYSAIHLLSPALLMQQPFILGS